MTFARASRSPVSLIRWVSFLALVGAFALIQFYAGHRLGRPSCEQDAAWKSYCISKADKCDVAGELGVAPELACSEIVASLAGWGGGSSQARRAVPPIIHQSWKTEDLPEKFALWASSWQRHHPDWTYNLWTDDSNRKLVISDFPWLLHAYERLPAEIQRADLARYLYMFKYGGIYADLDTWCLRPNENITSGGAVTVAEMGYDKDYEHNVPNAWVASAAGHPFWLFLSRVIMHRSYANNKLGAENATGPVILKHVLDVWRCLEVTNDIQVLEPGYVFVHDWHNGSDSESLGKNCKAETIHINGNDAKCIAAYPNAHVLTSWSHTWGR